MITISNTENDLKRVQAEDSRNLLKSLKSSKENNEFIEEFSRKYSVVAAERVLNYHFEECIKSFLLELKDQKPCIVNESLEVINSFTNRFGFHEKSLKILIERVEWDYNNFDALKINLIPKIFHENQKFKFSLSENIKSSLRKEIDFDNYVYDNTQSKTQIVSEEEFSKIVDEQRLIHISNNFYKYLIDKNEIKIKEFKNLLDKSLNSHEIILENVISSIKNGLLNIENSTSEILFTLKEIIPLLRGFEESCFVLDSCLRECKGYFKQFRNDLNSALLEFLLENRFEDFCLIEDEKDKNNPFSLEYPSRFKDTLHWKPDPIYINSFINPEIRTSNPINLLISQLSTNSLTNLSEIYHKNLAERLLKVENMEDIEKIVQEIEILKIKCGESFVSGLNVMINDLIESRSVSIKTSLKMTIISHRYWPEFPEKNNLEHPEMIKTDLIDVKSTYSRQFEDKRIIFRSHLDEVKVALEFEGGTFTFSCPIEAAIFINSFDFPGEEEEEEFDLKMATAITGISDKKILKMAIKFWLKKRILLSCHRPGGGNSFKFASEFDPEEVDCVDSNLTLFGDEDSGFVDEEIDDENDASGAAALQEYFKQFQQKYWSIIANMLKTFGQISAERIQSTLKMYSKEYKEPQENLTKFLQNRVKEGVLQSAGNRIILYSLVNKN